MGVVCFVIFWVSALMSSTYGSYVQTQALTGYGYYSYDPPCAAACLRSFKGYMLRCTDFADAITGADFTEASCYRQDTPYLTSVAYCISTKCSQPDIKLSKLQLFWEEQITGRPGISPKWTYKQALTHASPRRPHIINPVRYLAEWDVLSAAYRESALESTYRIATVVSLNQRNSIAIVALVAGLPIVLTYVSESPFALTILDTARPYLVWPSTIGTYQVRPLPYFLGNAPTVGQGIYIALFLIVNIVLSAIEYEPRLPSSWDDPERRGVKAYVLYRCGAFALSLFPVVILFSSRNNVLLWLTNWSHSTYLLLHQWVGGLFALYAILHSILGLMVYVNRQHRVWAWSIWGAIATVTSVILAVRSGLYVRKAQSDRFLISHILLTAFTIVGCWYHLIGWYDSINMNWPTRHAGGFEVWLYLTCALWFFDRLARAFRVLPLVLRRTRATDIWNGIARLNIFGGVTGRATGDTRLHLLPYAAVPPAVGEPPLIRHPD